jgi:hypothetical protein
MPGPPPPLHSVGSEVLTVVVMKSFVFWDIMQCSPLKVNRGFGGICRLHLEGRRISRLRNQSEPGSKHTCKKISVENSDLLVLPLKYKYRYCTDLRFLLLGGHVT